MKRKQIALNLIANIISVLIGLLISFFLTPYIVQTLGKDAYSFVPISNNFISYMSIFTLSMTSMTSRFVTIKFHSDDFESATEYFTTSFFSNLIMSLFVTIMSIFLVIFLDKIIVIPNGMVLDIKMLFAIMFFGFIFNLATTTFSVAYFSMNRLDIASMISIVGSFTRLILIYFLFKTFKPQVFYIGISMCAAIIVQGIMNYIASRKIATQLKISLIKFKINKAKELFISGVWNSFNQLSNILLTGVDLVIANLMIGVSASGTLAIAKTVPMALLTLINVVPIAFSPYLTILYAKADRQKFIDELKYTVKFTSILVAIPIAGFIAFSSDFFILWVPTIAGNQLTILSILTMLPLVASFSTMPLVFVFAITNRLKWPSIFVFISGLVNIVIVITLVKLTDLGLYAIAGVSSVLEIIRCLIFIPIYSAICLDQKKGIFYDIISRSIFYMIILVTSYYLLVSNALITNWTLLIVYSFISGIFGLIVGYFVMLDSLEKKKVQDLILSKIKGLKRVN